MGVDLQLRVESGARRKGRREETVVRASHEHGEALARILDERLRRGTGRLGQIDPYRDTRFNEQDAQAALPEVYALAREWADASGRAALLDLAELLQECVARPGSCLWSSVTSAA
ncbi:hypothetical protein [Streptomyces capoamus]|uniref:hypothetical protein n=1 Tax=Streptomyces capoamus TaxID=68183 RepID=UPI001E288A3B|nr:hypothetical protein [Streptomyces capoamus]